MWLAPVPQSLAPSCQGAFWRTAPSSTSGGGLQETHPTPVPVQEGPLQPRGLWHETRVTAVSWIPENLSRREQTTLSQCVGTIPGVQRWVAHLPRPCLPDSPSSEPPASGSKPPSLLAFCCQTSWKAWGTTPFSSIDRINPFSYRY